MKTVRLLVRPSQRSTLMYFEHTCIELRGNRCFAHHTNFIRWEEMGVEIDKAQRKWDSRFLRALPGAIPSIFPLSRLKVFWESK